MIMPEKVKVTVHQQVRQVIGQAYALRLCISRGNAERHGDVAQLRPIHLMGRKRQDIRRLVLAPEIPVQLVQRLVIRQQKGHSAFSGLNGRRSRPFVDPTVDLTEERPGFAPITWLLPFEDAPKTAVR